MKTVITWLCGLWALGLGLRTSAELLISDTGIFIPKHPLNIYFDFIPLSILGMIVSVFETNEMINKIRRKKWQKHEEKHEQVT